MTTAFAARDPGAQRLLEQVEPAAQAGSVATPYGWLP
jgi:hypothetical protein